MVRHKKHHDKDKYYNLAKEQGYRSRAAFKLIQINKKFDFLTKAKVLIDLCAAPGGWCQVAAKYMPEGSIVLGIDLLPIRPIKNVKTIVGDITTAETRRTIQAELQGWKADVVLCDGAPNVGAAYSKDAYVQNELALSALKTATDHLMEGGTFCTKVYRSQDYNALMWTLKHFFEEVQVIKPASSRSQSAEIFVVCLRYTNPASIDARMLDPAFVFKQVEDPSDKKINVLHKKHGQHQLRHRTGYDESLGMILYRTATLDEFVEAADPVQMLTDCNELTVTGPNVELYTAHKATTEEIRACFSDLRVLGRTDFKMLLKWRLRMKKLKDELNKKDQPAMEETKEEAPELTDADREALIQQEIIQLREHQEHKAKTQKKKDREKQAQLRRRQALGMETAGLDISADQELFRLEQLKGRSDLDAVGEVDLDQIADPFIDGEQFDEYEDSEAGFSDNDDEDGALEEELNYNYSQYLAKKRDRGAVMDLDSTQFAKRAKLRGTAEAQAMQRELDDAALFGIEHTETEKSGRISNQISADMNEYVKMLTEEAQSSDNDSDGASEDSEDSEGNERHADDDDEIYADDATPALIMKHKEGPSIRAERWFSNPIFADTLTKPGNDGDSDDDEDGVVKDTLSSLPKTDKELRREKRKKLQERAERRQLKRARHLEEEATEIDIVRGKSDGTITALDAQEMKRRELIRKGMGKQSATDSKDGFEVVPAHVPAMDERKYDSDNEEYTDHDRAVTLALGTLMLRKSRAKNLVDASYNRYAWNDSNDLPEWFVDDEVKHNRPQVPIPAALLTKMKERFQSLATKPIKKVAEARARKKRRAVSKLKAAKKKAASLAANPDMSERQKLKAIQATLKSKTVEKPGKVYVVARKSKSGIIKSTQKGSGKVKMVDARMKKEKRAQKRKNKR